MTQKDELVASVSGKLAKQPELPYQAAALGYQLHMLMVCYGGDRDEELKGLAGAFRAYIENHHLEELVANQIEYVSRLINSGRKLEYEEIHKIFSLCDEIEALRRLGLECDDATYLQYQNGLRR